MKQIDQDPGNYRVQRPDGRWTQRVNKPMCRIMGLTMAVIAVMAAVAPGETNALVIGVMGFLSGALITLSIKSIDW